MQFGCFYVMTVNKLDRNIKSIRKVVFVDEQGFQNEFDEIDDSDNVVHMLLCYDDESIGTCRCYKENGEYKIGRVAVLKEYRGKGLVSPYNLLDVIAVLCEGAGDHFFFAC